MSQLKFPGYENAHSVGDIIPLLALPFDQTDGSTPVEGTETKEFSPVFRNKFLKGGELAAYLNKDLQTFYQVFEQSVKIHKNRPSIGYRVLNDKTGKFNEYYSWETYEELAQKRTYAGSAFLHLVEKYAPDADPKNFVLSLFSANRPEWIISDLASHAYSIPNTPLYDTLGAEATDYILKLTESPIIVLSKTKIQKVLDVGSPFLKIIISIESITQDDAEIVNKAQEQGYHVLDFAEVLSIGAKDTRPHIPPTPETLYTISFTSGTTGTPKGVQLTHKNIVAGVTFLFAHVPIPEHPVSLVFLPLAHVYERFKIVYEIAEGGAIGFPHDPENVKSYLGDIKILKPTHMSSVPRLYNRIESGLKEKIKSAPGFKGWLLRFAVGYKLSHTEESKGWLDSILNKLVINKIKAQLGFENLDFLISGGSPLAGDSLVFLRKVLNCGFFQGYGSSETFGGIAITTKISKAPSSTGAIGVSAEFKLRNLPDLEYSYASNKSGELLLRGPQVFSTYYKNKEATSSAVDEEGWFSTGDIVKLDDAGRITVIDRVKNFFKLAQGEYIAAEKIENFYLSNNSILGQIFVYGDSFQSYLVGIVGVEEELLFKFVQNNYPKFSTQEQLLLNLNDLEFRKFILDELNKNIKHTGLFGFEKLKNIHLAIEPFKVSDETITPTLKLKRNNAQKLFQKEIDALYKEGPI